MGLGCGLVIAIRGREAFLQNEFSTFSGFPKDFQPELRVRYATFEEVAAADLNARRCLVQYPRIGPKVPEPREERRGMKKWRRIEITLFRRRVTWHVGGRPPPEAERRKSDSALWSKWRRLYLLITQRKSQRQNSSPPDKVDRATDRQSQDRSR